MLFSAFVLALGAVGALGQDDEHRASTIQNLGTGLCITLSNTTSLHQGTQVVVQTCNDPPTENQKWIDALHEGDMHFLSSPVNRRFFLSHNAELRPVIASDYEVLAIISAPVNGGVPPNVFILETIFFPATVQSPTTAGAQVFFDAPTGDLTEQWLITETSL